MESTLCRSIPTSRGAWLRLGDAVLDAAASAHAALRRLRDRWHASRRRAAEFRALRELSPSMLRDIGAEPETIHRAQHWREQHELVRDNFLRAP